MVNNVGDREGEISTRREKIYQHAYSEFKRLHPRYGIPSSPRITVPLTQDFSLMRPQ